MQRTFYYIEGVTDKSPKPLDYNTFHQLCNRKDVREKVEKYQAGDAEKKRQLPAVMWLGTPMKGTRKQEDCMPTQLYLIDIDHISQVQGDKGWTPETVWEDLKQTIAALNYDFRIRLVHKTPSGDGLRMVLYATENLATLEEHALWLKKQLCLEQYGKFDCLKNFDRVSFLVPEDYIFYESPHLFDEIEEFAPMLPKGETKHPDKGQGDEVQGDKGQGDEGQVLFFGYDIQQIIDERFRKGIPSAKTQSRHDQSLRLARDLMVMLDRDRELTLQVLKQQSWVREIIEERNEPVDQTVDSALAYIVEHEKKYGAYYALTKPMQNAIKTVTGKTVQELKTDPNEVEDANENEDDEEINVKVPVPVDKMPPAPPVIKELVSIAPDDFKIPAINALMPILGTLTSYVRAEDKQQEKTLSTSFFSIIWAPPSSGKSFVERYINWLLRDIMLRDEINEAKDAVFARGQLTRADNERGEAYPPTSVRIMEAKNSETEFLEKQRSNSGHHMFTYCSEIDQWRKGIKVAGGNKDDMVRIAWDNGKYGQSFKSSNTFKGKVQLFWNVLICGTSDQMAAYFRNVTNGLVTRCAFQEIKNQEFKIKQDTWGTLTKKERKVVDDFIKKCDRMTYAEPLNYNPDDCYSVSDKDFDNEVPWRFTFRPLTHVNIDWIIPTVNKFNARQCDIATRDQNKARDVFRRRVGERGKRLAIMCTQLYAKPMTAKDKRECAKWIYWWMEQDIEGIMEPFGAKYMKAIKDSEFGKPRKYASVYDLLPETFTKNDVTTRAKECGNYNETRNIITKWVASGYAVKTGKEVWKKTNKK